MRHGSTSIQNNRGTPEIRPVKIETKDIGRSIGGGERGRGPAGPFHRGGPRQRIAPRPLDHLDDEIRRKPR